MEISNGMMCVTGFMNSPQLVLNFLEEVDSCDNKHIFPYKMIRSKIKFLPYFLKEFLKDIQESKR
jgi:hypothetical protein